MAKHRRIVALVALILALLGPSRDVAQPAMFRVEMSLTDFFTVQRALLDSKDERAPATLQRLREQISAQTR